MVEKSLDREGLWRNSRRDRVTGNFLNLDAKGSLLQGCSVSLGIWMKRGKPSRGVGEHHSREEQWVWSTKGRNQFSIWELARPIPGLCGRWKQLKMSGKGAGGASVGVGTFSQPAHWRALVLILRGSVGSESLQPHGLYPARLLCTWDFWSKYTGASCHFLLQGIFPTHGSNPHLLPWQADSLSLRHLGRLHWSAVLNNFHVNTPP